MVLAAFFVMAISGSASADMCPPYNFYSSGMQLAMFFIIIGYNFPINLFWYSSLVTVSLLAVKSLPERLVLPPMKFSIFLMLVVLSMTAIGAAIDLQFLYALDRTWDHYYLTFEGVGWIVAALLIFITTFLLSVYVMGLGVVRSLVPSVTIAALNPIFWFWLNDNYLHGTSPDTFVNAVMLVSPVPFLVACLVCRRKALSRHDKTETELERARDKQTQSI